MSSKAEYAAQIKSCIQRTTTVQDNLTAITEAFQMATHSKIIKKLKVYIVNLAIVIIAPLSFESYFSVYEREI